MLGLVKYALLGCLIALAGAGFILFIITDFSGFVGFLKVCAAYMAGILRSWSDFRHQARPKRY